MEKDIEIIIQDFNDLICLFRHNENITINKSSAVLFRKTLNLLTRYKQLEEENKIYKEQLEKIDEVLNLEAGTLAPERHKIIESFKSGIKQLKKIIDNSIPKSKVKEILDKNCVTFFEGDTDFPDDASRIIAKKYVKAEDLQELLKEE